MLRETLAKRKLEQKSPNDHNSSSGFALNVDESFSAKLWAQPRKIKFGDQPRINFVAQNAVLDHNFGYEKVSLLQKMSITSTQLRKSSISRFKKNETCYNTQVQKQEFKT